MPLVHRFTLGFFLLIGFALIFSCGKNGGSRPEVTIYTSIYENVIAELAPMLEKRFPEIQINWFQKGSEVIASKVNTEIAAGKIQADIIMTSDPFWYEELKEAGHLLAHESANASGVPVELIDPDHHFVTVRVPVMVLMVNKKLSEEERPKSFAELADPKWKNRITMGDPLQSGSTFTAVAALAEKYGWQYFERLRENEMVAAGGNSTVLSRVAAGEKDVGMILLENILKEKQDNPGTPVETVYPADGAILVPSPIAIMKSTGAPDAAKQIYDFMLSDEGQKAIVKGNMYSPKDHIEAPPGAQPWMQIHEHSLIAWTPQYLKETLARREEIKRQFSRIMVE